MEISSIRVQHILDSARGVGDATRTSCVDARLSELHGAMRLATERVVRLQRASAAGERERAEREEALVLRLGERARIIEREARACVDPEPAMESGRVQLVVTIDANVPRDALRDHRGPATRPADAFTR